MKNQKFLAFLENLLIAIFITALVLIILVTGIQIGMVNAYQRIARGEVTVTPTNNTYHLDWNK